jgi:hypothetical protein
MEKTKNTDLSHGDLKQQAVLRSHQDKRNTMDGMGKNILCGVDSLLQKKL